VAVDNKDGMLRVVVRDRGRGFERELVENTSRSINDRFGLFSIRERMEYLGGSMTIESSPQYGSIVTITLPMETSM
jgi:signal transduction histidine kinase